MPRVPPVTSTNRSETVGELMLGVSEDVPGSSPIPSREGRNGVKCVDKLIGERVGDVVVE